MRKLLSIILILTLILPIIAYSEESIKALSDDQLKQAMSMFSDELRSRAKDISTDWILIFQCNGVKVYQTGEAEIRYSKLYIPVAVVNDLDYDVTITCHDILCNNWEIDCIGCGALPHAKKKDEIEFYVSDAFVESMDQIVSLKFKWWVIIQGDSILDTYYEGKQEEQRFW